MIMAVICGCLSKRLCSSAAESLASQQRQIKIMRLKTDKCKVVIYGEKTGGRDRKLEIAV